MNPVSPHVEAVGGIVWAISKPGDPRIALVFCNLDGALLEPVLVYRIPGGMAVSVVDGGWQADGTFTDFSNMCGGISLDDPCVTPLATERIVAAALDYVQRKGFR